MLAWNAWVEFVLDTRHDMTPTSRTLDEFIWRIAEDFPPDEVESIDAEVSGGLCPVALSDPALSRVWDDWVRLALNYGRSPSDLSRDNLMMFASEGAFPWRVSLKAMRAACIERLGNDPLGDVDLETLGPFFEPASREPDPESESERNRNRAIEADFKIWEQFAHARNEIAMPAAAPLLVEFIEQQRKQFERELVLRRIDSVRVVHEDNSHDDPFTEIDLEVAIRTPESEIWERILDHESTIDRPIIATLPKEGIDFETVINGDIWNRAKSLRFCFISETGFEAWKHCLINSAPRSLLRLHLGDIHDLGYFGELEQMIRVLGPQTQELSIHGEFSVDQPIDIDLLRGTFSTYDPQPRSFFETFTVRTKHLVVFGENSQQPMTDLMPWLVSDDLQSVELHHCTISVEAFEELVASRPPLFELFLQQSDYDAPEDCFSVFVNRPEWKATKFVVGSDDYFLEPIVEEMRKAGFDIIEQAP